MAGISSPMRVHVLLFDAGGDQEGIHSIELNGRTFTGTFFGQTGTVLFTRSFTK